MIIFLVKGSSLLMIASDIGK